MEKLKIYARIALVAAILLALSVGAGVCLYRVTREIHVDFAYSDQALGNPLMGYAPSAWYDEVNEDVSLLYADITWRELEPEEGEFAWEEIEEENQFSRWRAEGKHIVLRFVCDIPDDEAHMDIPDWLYEEIDGDGTQYDISYGRGFSPNYSNETFIACHQRAVAALGERYGADPLISYIELGSLGHWGEWHIKTGEDLDPMPGAQVRRQYVQHWVEAFPNTQLLMRRPFAPAAEYGMGLYNDMAGHPESTAEWLSWIAEGGVYTQTGEEDALVPMPDGWKRAPMGGELNSSVSMEQLLVTDLEQTISLIRDSHTTFLGPKFADDDYQEGYDALLANMGYRLWISDMRLSSGLTGGVKVQLTWRNSGVAPMYADWPAYLLVMDGERRVLEAAAVDIALSQLLPEGEWVTETALNPLVGWEDLDQYSLVLAIFDPMTRRSAVSFALEDAAQTSDGLVLWGDAP